MKVVYSIYNVQRTKVTVLLDRNLEGNERMGMAIVPDITTHQGQRGKTRQPGELANQEYRYFTMFTGNLNW